MSTIDTPGAPGPSGLTPSARLDAMSAVLARNWGWIALRGAFAVLFGIVAFAMPGAAILTLVIVFSAYMLVDGVAGIVAAIRAAERHERWGLLLVEGALNVIVGVAAFLLPGSAVLAFVYLTAAWAIVTGALMLAAAFRLHVHYGRLWLALGGIVSLIFGAALVANPAAAALVLTWWLAGYAIAFGIMLLVLAFRLRGRHAGTAPPGLGRPA